MAPDHFKVLQGLASTDNILPWCRGRTDKGSNNSLQLLCIAFLLVNVLIKS